jgi:hypothetical protein
MSEPVEPFAIPEIFATDCVIEDLGSGMKALVFSSPHGGPGGTIHQQNAVRMIMPSVCLIAMRAKLLSAADQVLYELLGSSNNHTTQ